MLLSCPHCRAQVRAPEWKPGVYRPRCPKCKETFDVTVDAAAGATGTFAAPSAVTAGRPAVSASVAGATTEAEATGAYQGGATGDFRAGAPEATAAHATGDFTPRPGGDGGNDPTEATGDFAPKPERASPTDPTPMPRKKPKKVSGLPELPESLGGYDLVKPLGQGGMGAVYLAQQVSLDRPVALKVMNPQWAKDPVFVARFVREAYAAAQLNHHNVVQIFDIGEQDDVHFFSMEFVEGKSLGDLIREGGKLSAGEAVAYTLQAARGLQFAHDRGMVHRDVKPDNLMLNREGLVKVADLGLVKTRDIPPPTPTDDDAMAPGLSGVGRSGGPLSGMTPTPLSNSGPRSSGPRSSGSRGSAGIRSVARVDVTQADSAMGTPAYMAPEQCKDAATVDGRADVYSLGCSLFALLTGRAPFTGKTAAEVIQKQVNDPPPPVRSVNPSVPAELEAVVTKSLEKNPDRRYASMAHFVAALKGWLEAHRQGPPRPSPEQAAAFEGLTKALVAAPGAKVAALLGVALPALGLVAGVALTLAKPPLGAALLLATLSGTVAGFVTAGVVTRSVLLERARSYVYGFGILDWLKVTTGVLLLVAALLLAGLALYGLGGIVFGAAVGVGLAFATVSPGAKARAALRIELDGVLRRLRVAGMDEESVRRFARDAAGDHWELVYETLFGYGAKLDMRAKLAEERVLRPKYGAWRDPLARRLAAANEARAARRAERHLTKLEAKRLVAEGATEEKAKQQAADAAADLVQQAAAIRRANARGAERVDVMGVLTRYERAKLDALTRPRSSSAQKLLRRLNDAFFAPTPRLLVGLALIVGSLAWLRTNADAMLRVPGTQTQEQALGLAKKLWAPPADLKPLSIPLVPAPVLGLFDSAAPLVAGVLLVLSAFTGSRLGIVWAASCAAFCLFAPEALKLAGAPPVAGLTPVQVGVALGGGLGLAGLVAVGRR